MGLTMSRTYQNKQYRQIFYSISYLGTNTSSSSDSQSPMARFFPLALTGDGVGGGVISIL